MLKAPRLHFSDFRRLIGTGVVLAILFVVSVAPANASVVTLSTRPGNGLSFGPGGYLANWNNILSNFPTPPAGYCDANITIWDYPADDVSNQGKCGGANNLPLSFHYKVKFTWNGFFDTEIAPDFGHGGEMYIDHVLVLHNPNDMWWDLDWNNTGQIFSFAGVLGPGDHTIDIYGQESCCDGSTAARFRAANGNFVAFGINDGLSVPEPSTLALSVTGLAGLMGYAWRRRKPVN